LLSSFVEKIRRPFQLVFFSKLSRDK